MTTASVKCLKKTNTNHEFWALFAAPLWSTSVISSSLKPFNTFLGIMHVFCVEERARVRKSRRPSSSEK